MTLGAGAEVRFEEVGRAAILPLFSPACCWGLLLCVNIWARMRSAASSLPKGAAHKDAQSDTWLIYVKTV
jgi:hypothetical protein